MLVLEQKSILKNSRKYENYTLDDERCDFCFFWFFQNPEKSYLRKNISFEKNAKTYFYNDSEIFHKNDKHIVLLK